MEFENEEKPYANAIKIFNCNVNFVYEELLNQFINNNGQCDSSTYYLINWHILIDSSNNSIYGQLETKIVYKCYISYLVNLFSKYIQLSDSDLLVEIENVLDKENLFSYKARFNFSVTNELKKLCLQKMANIVKRNENDRNYEFFKNLLLNQDLIENYKKFDDYSIENFYVDVCNTLKKDKYLNEKSLFRTLFEQQKADSLILNEVQNAQEFSKAKENDERSNLNDVEIILVKSSKTENPNRRSKRLSSIKLETIENRETASQRTTNKRKLSKKDANDDSNDEEYVYKNAKKSTLVKWKAEEIHYLVHGVEQFGTEWRKILSAYREIFMERSLNSLQMKYFLLKKQTNFAQIKAKAKNFVLAKQKKIKKEKS